MATTRQVEASIEKAAMMRASGCKWRVIAKAINRACATVRAYPAKHRKLWDAAIIKAEAEVRDDLLHLAYGVFLELLESDSKLDRIEGARLASAHSDRRHAINSKRRIEIAGKLDHKHSTYLDMVCDRLGIDPPVRAGNN